VIINGGQEVNARTLMSVCKSRIKLRHRSSCWRRTKSSVDYDYYDYVWI